MIKDSSTPAYQPEKAKAAPEIKATTGNEVANAFDDFMHAFESYKQANDERLEQMEMRMGADVVTTEKMERISHAMDEQKRKMDQLMIRQARPVLDGRGYSYPADSEHKKAFNAYIRRGDEAGLRKFETKQSLSQNSNAEGGYLVPAELDQEISRRLGVLSPIRSISSVRQVSGSSLKKTFSTNGMVASWIGEHLPRPRTDAITLGEWEFATREIYAMPAATQSLLEDSAVNIDEWILSEIEAAFAEKEETAFVNGNGDTKPKGFLEVNKIVDTSWVAEKLGFIPTGVAGAFPTTKPMDILIQMIYSLKSGYRQNATFVMNRKVQSTVRQFKDTNNNYIWQPPTAPGQKAMLFGFPVVESEDMPDIADDKFSIAFGDFKQGYLIIDRTGTRVLRDPYSEKPYVLFYTTRRVGGGVQNYEAIKLLKFATS